jgi:hypothetical protein
LQRLNELGHPSYHTIEKMKVKQNTLAALTESLQVWCLTVERLRSISKHSVYFASRQLWKIHLLLSGQKLDEKDMDDTSSLLRFACPSIHWTFLKKSIPIYEAVANPNENIQLLAEHLDGIFKYQKAREQPKMVLESVRTAVNKGEPYIAVLTDRSHVIDVICLLYGNIGLLPRAHQLLWCHNDMVEEECMIFLERCLKSQDGLFTIVNIQLAPYELQHVMIHKIKEWQDEREEFNVAMIICHNGRGRHHIVDQFSQNVNYLGSIQNLNQSLETVTTRIKNITSESPGLGKTERARLDAFSTQNGQQRKSLLTFPISGVVCKSNIVERLKEMRLVNVREYRALHIVIGEVDNPVALSEALFELLILRTMQVPGAGVYILPSMDVYIEVIIISFI